MPAPTTTTVDVYRETFTAPFDPATDAVAEHWVVSGARVNIGRVSGWERLEGGEQRRVDAWLWSRGRGVDVRGGDRVVDRVTSQEYRAKWVQERTGLGLGHRAVGLMRIEGVRE